ncbi:MAG: hypothetical protein P8046_02280 [Anaerolineales bacterium]
MPAIHLPRLRQQVEELIQYYAEPEKFLRELGDLFEYYGDHTRRTTENTQKPITLQQDNVPQPLLPQIVHEQTPYAENAPHAVLVLVRMLWQKAVLEYRQLATQLLGKLPLSYAGDTLTLVQTWTQANHEEVLLDSLSTHSLETLQREDPASLLETIEVWLSDAPDEEEDQDAPEKKLTPADKRTQVKLGLLALRPFVRDQGFQNLPRIYALLKPMMRTSPKAMRPYLLDLLRPLARRSPQEVAYILRTELDGEDTVNVAWLARRLLPELPTEHQERLRQRLFPQGSEN